MSDALFATRLRWTAQLGGIARHDGVIVELRQRPPLPGLQHATDIDFVPHIVGQVRIRADAMRDMTGEELHDALALLQRMARDARAGLETPRE